MKQEINRSVICFGEVLWDNLPSGKKPGGAPMNVAYHLRTLGVNSLMISRVGNDAEGRELMLFLNRIGLSTDQIQVDPRYPTSQVLAHISDNHEVSYEILYPVAWDFIEYQSSFQNLLNNADAFVYGSLIARNQTSAGTLFRMLETAKFRVFDINLRAPHYTGAVIKDLLQRSDLVKLNIHELTFITNWFSSTASTETERIEVLQEKFNTGEIIITKGGMGASYYTPAVRYDYPAYTVEVADTVGSGDSFLAAFLAKKLKGEPLEFVLDYASALGAFVTARNGGCPPYSYYDLERFIWKNELKN